MTVEQLFKIFESHNCMTAYVKILSPNDNSKNQVYVAKGDTEVLNFFPMSDFVAMTTEEGGVTFHASTTFYWVDDEGEIALAPKAKFILYPDYPEVRFSGFLSGCAKAPSKLFQSRDEGRVLAFGITEDKKILGYAAAAESEFAKSFLQRTDFIQNGFFRQFKLNQQAIDPRLSLLQELKRISELGWINSIQLFSGNVIAPCLGNKCGGTTLEAELGIIQNGRSEPDYLGYEVKQFRVRKFNLINSSRITLMTPEPDGGVYNSYQDFLQQYGYTSPSNPNRMDFTGGHKYGKPQTRSNLTLAIDGFDEVTGKMVNPLGGILLLDKNQNIAASWSFAKLLSHWSKKHAKAAYVPSISQNTHGLQFSYSSNILICTGTDFNLFLNSFVKGEVIYDPGMHYSLTNGKPETKKRSQFRIASRTIKDLYHSVESVDLTNI